MIKRPNPLSLSTANPEPYRGLVSRYCFSRNVRTRMKHRAEALGISLDEYKKLSDSDKTWKWRSYLSDCLYRKALNDAEAEAQIQKDRKAREKAKTVADNKLTTTGRRLATLKDYRLRVGFGSARAGKTHYILQEIIEQCIAFNPGTMWAGKRTNEFLCHIGGVNFPLMRASLIKDFREIMLDAGYWDDRNWNRSTHTYTFTNRATIQFFTYEARKNPPGLACHIYFFNEANHCHWELFDNIRSRCMGYGWLDFNPTHRFWFNDKIVPNKEVYGLGVLGGLTYLENEHLSDIQIAGVEANKVHSEYWKVIGEGNFNFNVEMCFNQWLMIPAELDERGRTIRDVPHEATLIGRGLDWGGQAGRTGKSHMAIVAAYKYKGGYLLDEELYEVDIGAQAVGNFISQRSRQCPVFADMANNRDGIRQIKNAGVKNIKVASKHGLHSIHARISFMNNVPIWITERSTNLWKEHKTYVWVKNQRGQTETRLVPNPDVPQDAIDAACYSLELAIRGQESETMETSVRQMHSRIKNRFKTPRDKNESFVVDFN